VISSVAKKRHQQKARRRQKEAEITAALEEFDENTPVLTYLTSWKNDKANWKFKKNCQNKLLKIIYIPHKLIPSHFPIFLEYLASIQSEGLRRSLEGQAQEILDKYEDSVVKKTMRFNKYKEIKRKHENPGEEEGDVVEEDDNLSDLEAEEDHKGKKLKKKFREESKEDKRKRFDEELAEWEEYSTWVERAHSVLKALKPAGKNSQSTKKEKEKETGKEKEGKQKTEEVYSTTTTTSTEKPVSKKRSKSSDESSEESSESERSDDETTEKPKKKKKLDSKKSDD